MKNMITIKLNKDLFDINNIERCIEDYADIAIMKYAEKEGYYVVDILSSCYEEKETAREFENYVIERTFRSQKICR